MELLDFSDSRSVDKVCWDLEMFDVTDCQMLDSLETWELPSEE